VVKRILDIGMSLAALLVLAPTMMAVAIAIRVSMGPPVLFRQLRPGLHGEPFELIKFRTMSPPVAPDGTQPPEHERVTRLGALLRRYSLDELPELWNVLRGDMCLVGPRPLLMEYLPRFSADQARRHEVPPGITGLAQVEGRHELEWEKRLKLDEWYVDHWSIGGDLWIMLRTLRAIPGGDAHAEIPEFEGTEAAGSAGHPGSQIPAAVQADGPGDGHRGDGRYAQDDAGGSGPEPGPVATSLSRWKPR
jgi:lipopolysaccharide/colanic/teichoic acid biosynthesis glycosyltransferase